MDMRVVCAPIHYFRHEPGAPRVPSERPFPELDTALDEHVPDLVTAVGVPQLPVGLHRLIPGRRGNQRECPVAHVKKRLNLHLTGTSIFFHR